MREEADTESERKRNGRRREKEEGGGETLTIGIKDT